MPVPACETQIELRATPHAWIAGIIIVQREGQQIAIGKTHAKLIALLSPDQDILMGAELRVFA